MSRSSAEAKYRSMAVEVAEITWLIGLFSEIGVKVAHPITVMSDSKAAIQIASNLIFHERTKHIEIDCHFIRGKIKEGLIRTVFVRTEEQQADLLTKGLSKAQHYYLMGKLGVLNILHPPT